MFIPPRCRPACLALLAGAPALVLFASPVLAQTELAKLTALDGAAADNFGTSVAIDGDTAVVGSPFDDITVSNCGSAYVFRQVGGLWIQEAKLVAFDRAANDNFGISVSVSGDVAVVGAWQDVDAGISSGSAYVYHRVGSLWTLQGKLLAADRENTDRFGLAVAALGDVIAVGADRSDAPGAPDAGAAYIYRFDGVNWIQEAKLNAADPVNLDGFGGDLALGSLGGFASDVLLVGARLKSDAGASSGAAYVFEFGGPNWHQAAKLVSADLAAGDQFGAGVAVSGTTAVLGAPLDDDAGSGSGSAYVFDRLAGVWTQTQKLTAGDGSASDNFGASVAISGDTLVAGAFLDNGQTGSAYMYQRFGGMFAETTQIMASDAAALDQFGSSVAISSGQLLIVSAAGDDDFGSAAGAAYVFELNAASADSDGDGLDDSEEAAIGTDPGNPDTDGDGLLDGMEVETAAGSGCPDPLNSDSDADGLSDGHENDFGPNGCNPDVDADGLSDGAESVAGSDPMNPDTDADGLLDGAEAALGSSPLDADTDDDDLGDALEVAFGTDVNDSDSDDDGLTDGNEAAIAGGSGCPNPTNADSDGDGLADGNEVINGLNTCDADSDGDGLADGAEASHGTSPVNPDTDGDGLLDGSEVAIAAGSGCPSPTSADSDADGIDDGNELTAGLTPCDVDSDDDSLSDGNESAHGTNPLNPDTDGDGLLDGSEVDGAMGTGCPDPLDGDSDNDSLTDGVEIGMGSSPCSQDTDGDGFNDAFDPTPTTPGVPPGFMANLTLATAGSILDTPTSRFLGPNNNVRQTRRVLLAAEVALAAVMIQAGNENAAIALLTIAQRRVDGQASPPDWMIESPDRQMIHSDITALITLLQLMN